MCVCPLRKRRKGKTDGRKSNAHCVTRDRQRTGTLSRVGQWKKQTNNNNKRECTKFFDHTTIFFFFAVSGLSFSERGRYERKTELYAVRKASLRSFVSVVITHSEYLQSCSSQYSLESTSSTVTDCNRWHSRNEDLHSFTAQKHKHNHNHTRAFSFPFLSTPTVEGGALLVVVILWSWTRTFFLHRGDQCAHTHTQTKSLDSKLYMAERLFMQ